jgi:hypothetical protein
VGVSGDCWIDGGCFVNQEAGGDSPERVILVGAAWWTGVGGVVRWKTLVANSGPPTTPSGDEGIAVKGGGSSLPVDICVGMLVGAR